MSWQRLQQKTKNFFNSVASSKEIFNLITITLLSLLLPLSFLLQAKLSGSQYYLQTLTWQHLSSESELPFPYLFSFFLRINPIVLYVLVSIITVATLFQSLAGKITLFSDSQSPVFQPGLCTAWILLCALQVSVGFGIEGSIKAGLMEDSDSSFLIEGNFLGRLIFLLGLHETMQNWCRMVVKPVVDDTVFGAARRERWVERVVIAASLGGLWWWKLRDEVETLVVMAEAKREELTDVGLEMAYFVGWWLYYLTVIIGMVRIVKGLMWIGMLGLCRRRLEISQADHPRDNDDKV